MALFFSLTRLFCYFMLSTLLKYFWERLVSNENISFLCVCMCATEKPDLIQVAQQEKSDKKKCSQAATLSYLRFMVNHYVKLCSEWGWCGGCRGCLERRWCGVGDGEQGVSQSRSLRRSSQQIQFALFKWRDTPSSHRDLDDNFSLVLRWTWWKIPTIQTMVTLTVVAFNADCIPK